MSRDGMCRSFLTSVMIEASFKGSIRELKSKLQLGPFFRIIIDDAVRHEHERVMLKPGDTITALIPF